MNLSVANTFMTLLELMCHPLYQSVFLDPYNWGWLCLIEAAWGFSRRSRFSWGTLGSLGRLRNRLGKWAGTGILRRSWDHSPGHNLNNNCENVTADSPYCWTPPLATDSSGQGHCHRVTATAAAHCWNKHSPKFCCTVSPAPDLRSGADGRGWSTLDHVPLPWLREGLRQQLLHLLLRFL